MNRLPDIGREAALAVGHLHHQPVAGRHAHMDVDQRAEVGHEFDLTRQAVVESGQSAGGNLDPFRPQRRVGSRPWNNFMLSMEVIRIFAFIV